MCSEDDFSCCSSLPASRVTEWTRNVITCKADFQLMRKEKSNENSKYLSRIKVEEIYTKIYIPEKIPAK